MIKNFSVPRIQNMVRADVFLLVLLRFLSVRIRRISDFSRAASSGLRFTKVSPHKESNLDQLLKRQLLCH